MANVKYWEDSQLRGSGTDHKFVNAQREDHACGICGLPHKDTKRPRITTMARRV